MRYNAVANVPPRITAPRDMSSSSLVDRNQHYGKISSFHFRGIKVLYSEDGGGIFLRSVGTSLPNYTAAKYRRLCTVYRLLGLLLTGFQEYERDKIFMIKLLWL